MQLAEVDAVQSSVATIARTGQTGDHRIPEVEMPRGEHHRSAMLRRTIRSRVDVDVRILAAVG